LEYKNFRWKSQKEPFNSNNPGHQAKKPKSNQFLKPWNNNPRKFSLELEEANNNNWTQNRQALNEKLFNFLVIV